MLAPSPTLRLQRPRPLPETRLTGGNNPAEKWNIECDSMFQRWAETRLYRKTMQLAIAELRRAARTPNVLEKLACLDIAEQKLKDAQWLSPEDDRKRFETGLAELGRSRAQTLEQALVAADRLLTAAEGDPAAPAETLPAAGSILSFLNHYLPEDARVEILNARLLRLGGQQPPYAAPTPLSDMYLRPAGTAGCGSAIGLLVLAFALALLRLR